MNPKPKIQFVRKLGHLFQVLYGSRRQFYGYGVTQKLATQQARKRYEEACQ